MVRDVLKALQEPGLVALRCNGDGWPRGLLSDTPIPDAWMGLVVKPDGRRRLVPAGENPRPDHDDTLVLVRNRAITVPLTVANIPSADGHEVGGTVELLVRWSQRDDDLGALFRNLLTGDDLELADLAQALNMAGAKANLNRFIRDHVAAELVHGDPRDALLDWFRRELQKFLFSSGLILERLGRVELTSDTLARHESVQRTTARRVQELQARDLVERTARAATQKRLDDLGSVLLKLKQTAATDRSLQWRELLPTLTPGERG